MLSQGPAVTTSEDDGTVTTRTSFSGVLVRSGFDLGVDFFPVLHAACVVGLLTSKDTCLDLAATPDTEPQSAWCALQGELQNVIDDSNSTLSGYRSQLLNGLQGKQSSSGPSTAQVGAVLRTILGVFAATGGAF